MVLQRSEDPIECPLYASLGRSHGGLFDWLASVDSTLKHTSILQYIYIYIHVNTHKYLF